MGGLRDDQPGRIPQVAEGEPRSLLLSDREGNSGTAVGGPDRRPPDLPAEVAVDEADIGPGGRFEGERGVEVEPVVGGIDQVGWQAADADEVMPD